MEEEQKKYVVYSMRAKCSNGSMENYLTTDVGHGVVYQGNPMLNANDHIPGVNLTHFGDCYATDIFEKAKAEADEKYKADGDDGFFESAGKWIAKTAIKTVASAQEFLGCRKCELDTPIPWINVNEEHKIDGAPALIVESQCACRYGGIISIVVQEENAENSNSDETKEITVVNEKVLAEAPNDENKDKKKELRQLLEFLDEIKDEIKDKIERAYNKDYFINKYVNEEFFFKINSQWEKNMDQFKSLYGDDVFDQMRKSMSNYNLTSEESVLIFLATIGVETGHGKEIQESLEFKDPNRKKEYMKTLLYEDNTKGAGLIQITGDAQKRYLAYKKQELITLQKECGDDRLYDNYQKEIEEVDYYLSRFGEETVYNIDQAGESKIRTTCEVDVSKFIADRYPVDSTIWYWCVNIQNAAITDQEKSTDVKPSYIYMSINEYIDLKVNANTNTFNLFLTVQHFVNGKQGWSFNSLERMCDSVEDIRIEEPSEAEKAEFKNGKLILNGVTGNAPNGWNERLEDWEKICQIKMEENKK